MSEPIKHRFDFVLLFDVENGNPNGDPDAGNMPRQDLDTGVGLVTDVCLKRKVRNYVAAVKENAPGFRIYVEENAVLEDRNREAFAYLGLKGGDKKDIAQAKKKDADLDRKVRDFMCENFYDIRTFGAVLTTFTQTGLNCGQVRGPVQLGFAQSIDPVMPQEIGITREAVSSVKEKDEGKHTMMGRKYIIPYGLYRVEGYVSANLARKTTGFSKEDLKLLWEALANMFEVDRAAGRGNMSSRKLVVFKHESELGNAPAWELFDRVRVERKAKDLPARKYTDYNVTVDTENLPAGVSCEVLLG